MNEHEYKYKIEKFLKKVKEKLPSWIREDTKECTDILEEMEEHIMDLAQDLAGGPEEEISMENIHEAIARMGSPEEITREYKKRGTPKYYLSEEWVQWYKKILTIVLGVIMAINVISLIFSFGEGETFWQIAGSFLSGIWGTALFSFIVISIIFVALSMEGFLPQDFKEMNEKYGKYVEKKPKKSQKGTHGHHFQHRMRKVEKDLRRLEKTAEEATIKVERAKAKVSIKIQEKHKNPPIKIGDCLWGGIWGILWGMFLIMQPIESFNVNFTPEFLEFIRIIGTLTFSEAIIKLFQAFVGIHRSFTQQILLFLLGLIQGLYIVAFVNALKVPEILQIFSIASGITWNPNTVSTIFKIVMYLSIFGTSIDILKKLTEILKYQGRLDRYYTETFD